MDYIYNNIEKYNPNKKRKILIVFDDIIADMLSNKELNPIVTELFIRGRKLNISLAFITQSYFAVPENIRLNSTHYIDFKGFMSLYKKYTANLHSFLIIDATLASDNHSRFRKNLFERIQKLIMKIDDKIIDEKLQYNIYREAAKISALSPGKIEKYEYLTSEEIMPSNQKQIIEQVKFAYFHSGKAFEKKTEKQVGALKPIDFSNKKNKN